MRRTNKYSRLLLALLLLVAGLAGAMRPHSVAAQNSGTTGPLNWNYDAGTKTLSITGSGAMPDFNFPINQPWGAFRGQIETVTIGAGVKSVGENAFASCKKLTAVNLPSSVTTIGVYAFSNCKALTGITIPSGVKTIKESAFYGCTALTSVTLPEGLTTIEEGVFTNCDALASIELPASLQTIDASALDAPGLTEIKVQTGNTHFEAAEGVLYNKGKTALLRYPRKKPGTTFTVPASVTTIGEYAFAVSGLTNVTLPDGLQTIGTLAFNNCEALTGVTIPKDVTTIGESAFQGCTALTSVTLPADAKLTTIEQGAFYACEMLTSITLPEGLQTIGGNVFNTCEKLPSITIPKSVTTIGDGAFAYCSALKDVTVFWNTPLTIPSGVFAGITPPTGVTLHVPGGTGEAYQANAVWGKLTIEELPWGDFDTGLHWAYDATTHSLTITNPTPSTPQPIPNFNFPDEQPWKAYRGEIQAVTIGAGVNHVGKYAFTNCAKLATVTLPEGLETIGNYAFGECAALASISIPNSVTAIADGAFTECTALKSVTLPNSLTTIGKYAFSDCSALTSITLPEGIQTIGEAAFYNCAALASISIPNSVTAIGQNAFNECLALKSITIPNSVTAIADGVFAGCKALTTVTLPTGLQTIGKNAFLDCAALASISIPNSVTAIGDFAFQGCTALKDVTVAWETPLQPNSDAFKQLPLDKIRLHVPEGKIGAYKAANVWRDFIVMADRGDLAGGLKWQMDATYTLTIINPTPGSPKPMPDFNNWDEQPWESFRREIQAVTIGDGVSSVGETAFSGCNKMTHVTLPKSVTTIREGAFAGCNKMTHVTLPADGRLDTIGKEAFIRCSALTSISLPKSVTTIEDRAFSVCEALTSVTLPADGKLQTIGVNAFGGCIKLKSITLPHSVTKIESNAFSSCEGLASVTLPKSVTTIEDDAFQDCKALKDLTVAWRDTASIPKITLDVFQYTPPATVKLSDIRLHVPHGTVAAYQLEDVWKEFTIVEQPLPPAPTPEIPETPSTPPTPPFIGKKIGGIALSPSSFVLDGERTFRFTATISPSDAADKRLIVSSSDETVVRVRILPAEEMRRGLRAASDPAVVTVEGTVYGIGKAKVNVKSTDGSGLNATCQVEVRSLPTGNIEASAARIYTSAGRLYLSLPTATRVEIYSLLGTLLRGFTAPAGTSSVALPTGMYVVRTGNRADKVVVN